MSTERHITPSEVVAGLVWTWIIAALALTAALVVVGGFFVLESATVRVVLGVLLVAATLHLVRQHRHRREMAADPRLRVVRERRGF